VSGYERRRTDTLAPIHYQGETAEEIAGLAGAMRKAAIQVDCGSGVLDIAGTGGDGCVRSPLGTFPPDPISRDTVRSPCTRASTMAQRQGVQWALFSVRTLCFCYRDRAIGGNREVRITFVRQAWKQRSSFLLPSA
jgi:hypothetical protein